MNRFAGLRLLGLGLQRAPFPVEGQYLGGALRQAAPGEAAVEFLRVLPDPSQIVHVPDADKVVIPAKAGTHGSAIPRWINGSRLSPGRQ